MFHLLQTNASSDMVIEEGEHDSCVLTSNAISAVLRRSDKMMTGKGRSFSNKTCECDPQEQSYLLGVDSITTDDSFLPYMSGGVDGMKNVRIVGFCRHLDLCHGEGHDIVERIGSNLKRKQGIFRSIERNNQILPLAR